MYELKNFLNDNNNPNSFHLILLQETWLNQKVHISLPGYNCLRQDRESNPGSRYPHGGVLIFIRKEIEYKRVKFANTEFAESVFVKIDTGSFSLTIGSVYCASTLSQKQFRSDLHKLLSQRGPYLLAGDWNAKDTSWNNFHGNRKGTFLRSLCDEKLCDIHFPNFPTLTPDCNKGEPSIVDFVISREVYDVGKPETLMELKLSSYSESSCLLKG